MKPTRGLSPEWLSSLPRERKVALGSLAILMALIASLTVYGRFTAPSDEGGPDGTGQAAVDGVKPGTQAASAAPNTEPGGTAAEPGDDPEPEVASGVAAKPAPTHLLQPLTGERAILQPYAFMYSEAFGDYRLHPGVDYAAAKGDSVMAAASGKVVAVDSDPVEGKVVEIAHDGGMVTRYGGLGQIMVGVNATLQAGHMIGQVGDPTAAKKALGSHLHFEVLLGGSPADPTLYYQR